MRKALEGSLQRLKTDYIDIWQIHNARMEQVQDGELIGLLDAFKAEGKIKTWGVALGPAIGWLWEGIVAARRNAPAVQMIWNVLEPFPGDEMVARRDEAGTDTTYFIRVPHSSGMLEGKYTSETTFAPTDHRSHRPKSWLINGVKKVETLRFLERPGRTLGQAAIQWLLAEPRVMSVLPNIYDREQLREFAAAPDTPHSHPTSSPASPNWRGENFGLPAEEGRYKGTMTPPSDLRSRRTHERRARSSAPTSAPAPIGPYSQAVAAGRFLFCSGQVGIDADGKLAEAGSKPQTRQVMKNVGAVLTEAGLDFADIVKTTIYLVDMNDFAAVNAIYGESFAAARRPRARRSPSPRCRAARGSRSR